MMEVTEKAVKLQKDITGAKVFVTAKIKKGIKSRNPAIITSDR